MASPPNGTRHRYSTPITRTLAGTVGHDVAVTFTT